MHRYFVKNFDGMNFLLDQENHHHIKNVVKLSINDEVVCIFEGVSYLCTLSEISDKETYATKKEKLDTNTNNVKKILILGIIREQKWDFVLQKATELGVDIIVPVEFKRNVVKIDDKKMLAKVQRWSKICEDAAEQSYRNTIPLITDVVRNISDLKQYISDINLAAWEEESDMSYKEYINQKFKSISFIVGPEGGIEPKEIQKLNELGFKTVTLGKNIMRAETVPLFIMSVLNFVKE